MHFLFPSTEQSGNRRRFIYIAAVIIIIFAVIRILMEAFQMIQLRLFYFFSWVNWVELLLFICSIIFVWIFHSECLCPSAWQWQVGAVAVFLGWIDLIVFIRKLPLLGIYVVMLVDILYTFCRLIVLTILLIIAFGLAFYMCFYDPAFRVGACVHVHVYTVHACETNDRYVYIYV